MRSEKGGISDQKGQRDWNFRKEALSARGMRMYSEIWTNHLELTATSVKASRFSTQFISSLQRGLPRAPEDPDGLRKKSVNTN